MRCQTMETESDINLTSDWAKGHNCGRAGKESLTGDRFLSLEEDLGVELDESVWGKVSACF